MGIRRVVWSLERREFVEAERDRSELSDSEVDEELSDSLSLLKSSPDSDSDSPLLEDDDDDDDEVDKGDTMPLPIAGGA